MIANGIQASLIKFLLDACYALKKLEFWNLSCIRNYGHKSKWFDLVKLTEKDRSFGLVKMDMGLYMKSSIEKIDKNFKIDSVCDKNVIWFDWKSAYFKLQGLHWSEVNHCFVRMPEKIAYKISDEIAELNTHTAGGKLRFKTNSPYIALKVVYASVGKMGHFALSGSAGFDLYNEDNEDNVYYLSTFVPPFEIQKEYNWLTHCASGQSYHQYHINFPTYSAISSLQIGIAPGCDFIDVNNFDDGKSIVFYGSSITQGGCCSRPGNSYTSIVSRKLKLNCINLGFSGNAKGENEMARYISGLKMSAFVYDYDHNAPTEEHLANTHKVMFDIIRNKNMRLPILILSRPKAGNCAKFEYNRIQIIRQTYIAAVESGDKNVAFVDGSSVFNLFGGDSCTVDNCHPNDMGFMCMADIITSTLEKMI